MHSDTTDTTKRPDRRGRGRQIHYPERVNVALSREQFQAIEREAEREGWPLGAVVRAVLEVGLPIWRERRRKRRASHD